MELNESLRSFPIKFYENPDGTIHYENAFLDGNAKNMKDAFKYFQSQDLDWDLPYYYDDVTDVEIGTYIPALTDKKVKGRKYLGKLELRLGIDTNWGTGEHSVTYLSKNRQDIPKQQKFIQKLKREEARDKFIKKLKTGLQNVWRKIAGVFDNDKYEMFFPEKTRKDLICVHCGNIIPTGAYYEEYRSQNYHLECMWDMFFNENKSNDYEDAREFFFSLQKYKDKWPAHGLDTLEDYNFDLDLVRNNDRKFK